jgi:energy-coupling factor transport system permease protein
LVPILTTPINTLVLALQKVGLPYNWGMMVGLALRYLETIQKLYTNISEAQQARGWDVTQGGIIRRARGAIPVLIAVIINSLRLGDSLALGLAARGFGLKQPRTTWKDITMQPLDWVAMVAVTALFTVGLWFVLR